MGEAVLLVHNRYRERGGEDRAVETERRLLERFGHRVIDYERSNDEIAAMSRGRLALRTVWSVADHDRVGRLVRQERVAVAHFHNTFPLISPAAHYAARRSGAAVVQTLHNFRLLCPNALFLRNGRPCEDCLGRAVPWPAVLHRCYRGSVAATGALTGMLVTHRLIGTWHAQVDAFIALSRFARDRFAAGGLPADRLHVRGAALDLELTATTADRAAVQPARRTFLYVGRLAAEKGIDILLEAWQRLDGDIALNIVGDGPLAGAVRVAAAADRRIEWLGAQPQDIILERMRTAWALIFPSICYENAPVVLAEAQLAGLPVIASDLGSGAEVVRDGGFGVLVEAGNATALAGAVARMHTADADRAAFAARAYTSYHTNLAPESCYASLRRIYDHALQRRNAAAAAGADVRS
jgi:glycosyltransferase involved in cell wall biosynthesis